MQTVWLIGAVLLACGNLFDAEAPARQVWTVDNVKREAMVYAPRKAKTEATPVVFVWHGHGGSMDNSVRTFAIHTLWPQAIVVYPQGLPTPSRSDPEGTLAGWQYGTGELGDRDLKFFDAVLESLRTDWKVDDKRIYSTGHSNGGAFTYLLWITRGDALAAIAPSGAGIGGFPNRATP